MSIGEIVKLHPKWKYWMFGSH